MIPVVKQHTIQLPIHGYEPESVTMPKSDLENCEGRSLVDCNCNALSLPLVAVQIYGRWAANEQIPFSIGEQVSEMQLRNPAFPLP